MTPPTFQDHNDLEELLLLIIEELRKSDLVIPPPASCRGPNVPTVKRSECECR